METVREAGLDLANRIGKYVGWTVAINTTCREIASASRSYGRVQEAWCNEDMAPGRLAYMQKREGLLEKRIDSLVRDLPDTDDGPFRADFAVAVSLRVSIIHPDGTQVWIA